MIKQQTIIILPMITLIILFSVYGFKEVPPTITEGIVYNTPMPLPIPSNFPKPVYDFSQNPLTKEGFELGRRLFYDPILSRDSTISCGSCHIQANAFTQHGHDLSHGIDDQLGTRNSPPIMNLAWSRFFFWDGGVFNLDLQPIGPIENPVEMDAHLPSVTAKLKQSSVYRSLFKRAFGTDTIRTATLMKALSQFMLQCVSANSKYDRYIRKEGEIFSPEEQIGLNLFHEKCASCHATDLFTDNRFHNNGLVPSTMNDSGRFRISLIEEDKYLFKTPSLRNVAVSAPYMHDGRFRTLMAVLDHYETGVQPSPTLDTRLFNNNKTGITLTITDKNNLIAFLNTLTDLSFLKDPKLAEQ